MKTNVTIRPDHTATLSTCCRGGVRRRSRGGEVGGVKKVMEVAVG